MATTGVDTAGGGYCWGWIQLLWILLGEDTAGGGYCWRWILLGVDTDGVDIAGVDTVGVDTTRAQQWRSEGNWRPGAN